MRIVVLISHPTQFEAPFFQSAARDPRHALEVIYSNTQRLAGVRDPELNRNLHWGIDLLGGYKYKVVPARGRLSWMRAELAQSGADLLIVNSYVSWFDLAAAVMARRMKIPVALRLDMVLFNSQSRLKRAAKRIWMFAITRLFTRFFVIGSLTREYLEYFGVARERMTVFTYPIDAARFGLGPSERDAARARWRARVGIRADAFVVASVTKFNQREAPWDLIAALRHLGDPGIVALCVGDGAERQALETRAREAGVRVYFPGYVDYPLLPEIYAAADLFVHPAQNEPWGVSIGEAVAAGIPVIASDRVGSGRDLIRMGSNGFVYTAGCPLELADAIRQARRLDPAIVAKTNQAVVMAWGHEATWNNLVAAAQLASGHS